MNCCDEYGDCRQGRDCPVRGAKVAKVGRRDYSLEELPPTTWRNKINALAGWIGLALLGWLIWLPLIYLLLRK